MLVWASTISTRAVWLSPSTSTMMWRLAVPSRGFTVHTPVPRRARSRSTSSGFTVLSTSIFRSGSPARAPRRALVSMPRRSPVVGTMTPFTFLMMFPLQETVMCSGKHPSRARARAAA